MKHHFTDTEESHCCAWITTFIDAQRNKLDVIPTNAYTSARMVSDPFETLCNHVRKTLYVRLCNRGWLEVGDEQTHGVQLQAHLLQTELGV